MDSIQILSSVACAVPPSLRYLRFPFPKSKQQAKTGQSRTVNDKWKQQSPRVRAESIPEVASLNPKAELKHYIYPSVTC